MTSFGRLVVIAWLFIPAQVLLWCFFVESWKQAPVLSALFGFLSFVHFVITLDQLKKRGLTIQKSKERQRVIGLIGGIALGKSIIKAFSNPERFFDSWIFFLIALPYVLFLGPLPDAQAVVEECP